MNPGNAPRQCARFTCYRDLAIAYEGHGESVPVRAPDISPRGMFINMAKAFPEGSVLKVRFRLGRRQKEITARAEVRYSLPGIGIGVEFVDISPAARAAIEEELAADPEVRSPVSKPGRPPRRPRPPRGRGQTS